MSTLAITGKWEPILFGFGNNEDPKFITILSKLIFVWELGAYPHQINSFDAFGFLKDYIDEIGNINNQFQTFEQETQNLNISIIKGFYIFKSRMFAIPNKSFERFIQKVKSRYKYKIQQKKNVKNLLNRQLYGKYIHK